MPRIRVLPHIRHALDTGAPVVALESSVFAHGLPSPANAEAARRMVAAVESIGAVAAITAVLCGEPAVGMENEELKRFFAGRDVRKVSARDLGAAIAQRADGATTVAAAIAIASAAGIRVLATGGIGGVHRRFPTESSGYALTPSPAHALTPSRPHALTPSPPHALTAVDESADLLELASTPMIVVCAGAKSILDLPATWERLETLGIPVVGVRTGEFPGFYSANTGIRLSVSVESADEVARIAESHFALGRQQSVLVVQPPPSGAALEAEEVEEAVRVALERAGREGIRGSEVTPYLLAEVSRKTDGKSLATNLALLEANAMLAAEIARAGKIER